MRILPALTAIAAIAASSSPAAAASKSFGVSGFDRVRVDGPYRVVLTTGVSPFAKASGGARALDAVAIDVQGRTLVVRSNSDKWGSAGSRDEAPVEIAIGTHDLTTATLNGAGTLAIDKVRGLKFGLTVVGSGGVSIGAADVDQLTTAVSGTGSARIGGKARHFTAIVRGISSVDSAGLAAKDAVIAVDGAATVSANVSNAVKITGSGPGSITLSGKPACTAKLIGSGSVSGCR